MDKPLLASILEANGITDKHEKAMFNLFIKMLLQYQIELGISTKDLQKYMSIVLTFIELIEDENE